MLKFAVGTWTTGNELGLSNTFRLYMTKNMGLQPSLNTINKEPITSKEFIRKWKC